MDAPIPSRYPSESTLYDAETRHAKADKISAILRHALGDELGQMRCLDVGCASGLITRHIADQVGTIIGLEYDLEHVQRMGANTQDNLLLIQGNAQKLPLADGSLDLVICAQVYEHVADADSLAQEIYRVLQPGGVCFFSGPNRLDPIERHYGLPFVSWLPQKWADAYLRLTGRGKGYPEHPRTLWGLRKLWADFEITDYTLRLVMQPEAFGMQNTRGLALAKHLPSWLLRALLPWVPNYNWILCKHEGHKHAHHCH